MANVNLVNFVTGTSAQFALATKNANTLYFISDTHQIYKGNQLYSMQVTEVDNELPASPTAGSIYVINRLSDPEDPDSDKIVKQVVYIDLTGNNVVVVPEIVDTVVNDNSKIPSAKAVFDSLQDAAAIGEVHIVSATETGEDTPKFIKTYSIWQGGTETTTTDPDTGIETTTYNEDGTLVGKIDIPKDFLVKSVSVINVTQDDIDDETYGDAISEQGDYMDFVINVAAGTAEDDQHIYVNLKTFAVIYEARETATIDLQIGYTDPDTGDLQPYVIYANVKDDSIGYTQLDTEVETTIKDTYDAVEWKILNDGGVPVPSDEAAENAAEAAYINSIFGANITPLTGTEADFLTYKNSTDDTVAVRANGKVYLIAKPDDITEIDNTAELVLGGSGGMIAAEQAKGVTNATITIANGISAIGDSALEDAVNVTTLTIPASVTTIGANAFAGTTALTGITVNSAEGTITGAPWGADASVTITYTV